MAAKKPATVGRRASATKGAEAFQMISTHEAVCAERYEGILRTQKETNKRLERLERIMIGVSGTMLVASLSMIGSAFAHILFK